MIQQCMARKADDDVHYAGAVYKYAREYAVSIHNLSVLFALTISIKYQLENLVFQLPLYLVGIGCLL